MPGNQCVVFFIARGSYGESVISVLLVESAPGSAFWIAVTMAMSLRGWVAARPSRLELVRTVGPRRPNFVRFLV